MAPGSNPKHTISAFSIYIVDIGTESVMGMRKRAKINEKEARIVPCFKTFSTPNITLKLCAWSSLCARFLHLSPIPPKATVMLLRIDFKT